MPGPGAPLSSSLRAWSHQEFSDLLQIGAQCSSDRPASHARDSDGYHVPMIALGWFILGIVVLIAGAELLVRGGSRVAAQLGVPPLVIGLTIVAVGTSTPELAVGIDAALQGNGALAVGNIAGTNMANILLILGLSALLEPLALQMQTLRFDLPSMVAAALVLMVTAWDGVLTRGEGIVLLGLGALYTVGIAYFARRESRTIRAEFAKEFGKTPKRGERSLREAVWSLAALLAGIVVIVVGADWFVDGAVGLARMMGVSDAFIGLTIVALGTSSPELVTTIVGTLKKERDIAVGNLLGSSVYNILVILGSTCLAPARGIPVEVPLIRVDIPVMAAAAFACVPVFMSGRCVTRLEGGIFVGAYVAYLTYLIATRT